jgi:hypothetical protein
MASYEGLTVQAIGFPDLPAAAAQRLLDLIPQKVGAPLQREDVRESIQSLHATGRFADIQVEAEHAAQKQVVLLFRTRPNFFVGEIQVEGAPNPPAANQVVNATKLQLGELFTREEIDRALVNIKQLMEQNGYYATRNAGDEHCFSHRAWTARQNRPRYRKRCGRIFARTGAGYCQDAPGRLCDGTAREPRPGSATQEVSETEPPLVTGSHRQPDLPS